MKEHVYKITNKFYFEDEYQGENTYEGSKDEYANVEMSNNSLTSEIVDEDEKTIIRSWEMKEL